MAAFRALVLKSCLVLQRLSCESLEEENAEVNAEDGGLTSTASEGRFV